jgi:Sulfatase
MPADNILVIVIDGLRASALGAYGNTTFPTPALDQFAVESFLPDFVFADSTDLSAIYRALWQSRHPLRPAMLDASAPSLAKLLSGSGYVTTLITDDPDVGSHSLAADFDECVQLDGEATVRVNDASQTCVAQLLAAVCETILSPHENPRLVWAHSRGMFGPWDAPLALQESLLDHEEGDPAPCELIEPPSLTLADMPNSEAAFAISCAYAAQVMLLDDCIEVVHRTLLEIQPEKQWLTLLTGSRGFAHGEHGHVGGGERDLYAESLQVPMLWRFPAGTNALARSQRLVSHLDVLPTLLDWIGGGPEAPAVHADGLSLLPLACQSAAAWRDELVASNESGRLAMRTPEWCLQRAQPLPDGEEPTFALFVRPDDRCEANDIASLCPDVVEHLSATLDAASRRLIDDGDVLASAAWTDS